MIPLSWATLAHGVLHDIFSYLPARDLSSVGAVNRHWYHISREERLWKHLYSEQYPLWDADSELKVTGRFYDEYNFFMNDVPKKLVQTIDDFTYKVREVEFSCNGTYFATLGGNATICLFTTKPDVEFLHERDLDDYLKWETANRIEFSPDESKFLVSGIRTDKRAEFAVFAINETSGSVHYICRVLCAPIDFGGCWFNNDFLVSGEHYAFSNPTAFGSSISQLWLCNVPKDKFSLADTSVCPFLRFLNKKGYVHRALVAQHVAPRFRRILQMADEAKWEGRTLAEKLDDLKVSANIDGNDDERELRELKRLLDEESNCQMCFLKHTLTEEEYGGSIECVCTCHHLEDKLLIYVTGEMNERICFKLITPEFIRRVLNLKSIEVDEEDSEMDTDGLDYVMKRVHQLDHFMDFEGIIHEMKLSHDQKTLLVAIETVVEDEDGNAVSTQIEQRRIDLEKMIIDPRKNIGKVGDRAAVTSENLIVSSHEKDVLVWSRDYGGAPIQRLTHEERVSSVAVHPRNTMVLTCCGNALHIWEA